MYKAGGDFPALLVEVDLRCLSVHFSGTQIEPQLDSFLTRKNPKPLAEFEPTVLRGKTSMEQLNYLAVLPQSEKMKDILCAFNISSALIK
jgi:hypothetical protein